VVKYKKYIRQLKKSFEEFFKIRDYLPTPTIEVNINQKQIRICSKCTNQVLTKIVTKKKISSSTMPMKPIHRV
jgi:ADP-glucose pyrophosphorylase